MSAKRVETAIELDVDDGTDDGHNATLALGRIALSCG